MTIKIFTTDLTDNARAPFESLFITLFGGSEVYFPFLLLSIHHRKVRWTRSNTAMARHPFYSLFSRIRGGNFFQ